MSKVRYIKAHECQNCFATFDTQCKAQMCCEDESKFLEGYECKQCFKVHDTFDEARHCHPDPKPMSYKDIGIDAEEPVAEEDAHDEILIGGVSVTDTIKPLEVTLQ